MCANVHADGSCSSSSSSQLQNPPPTANSIHLNSYEGQTYIYNADGSVTAERGTRFKDQVMNRLQMALAHNDSEVSRLINLYSQRRDSEFILPMEYIVTELCEPYLRLFKFLMKHTLAGTAEASLLLRVYFIQIGKLLWLVLHRRVEEYTYDEYREQCKLPCMTEMPTRPPCEYTQMDCIRAMAEFTYVIKHVGATEALSKLALAILVQSCYYLMGSGSLHIYDGYSDKEGSAFSVLDKRRNGLYAANGRYVMHLAVRAFYIIRFMRHRQFMYRQMSSSELEFLMRFDVTKTIRQIVNETLKRISDTMSTRRSDLVAEGRLSLGDRELNSVWHAGQYIVTDIVRNIHPKKGASIHTVLTEMSSLSIESLLQGVAGVDVAEELSIYAFLLHASGNDTRVSLYDGFVIPNAALDLRSVTAKIMTSTEPLFVQTDARFYVMYRQRKIITYDVYETLALWLAIVYVDQGGIPEKTAGCLRATFKEIMGDNTGLPAPAVYIE
jgi:hypothetical protein